MKLRQIMTRKVEVIHPDDTVESAAQRMRDQDIGFLPVCDGDKLIGVLSDRDIVLRVVADGKDPKKVVSRDLVSSPVLYCYDDQDVGEAARMMHDKQVRRLPVISREDKKLVGVISLGDIAINSAEEVSGEALQGISLPQDSPKKEEI